MTKQIYKQRSRSKTSATLSSSIYARVTQKILAALSSGVIPWRKPWRGSEFLPCNAVSKRPYHGINLMLLSLAPYRDHRWLTLRQANELGGQVRLGERSSTAVFWKCLPISEEEVEVEKPRRVIPLLRQYAVFNVEQCQGLSLPVLEDWTEELSLRTERAERVIQQMPDPPRIVEGGSIACYQPPDDLVRVPRIRDFDSPQAYYSTLFHELGHATGHERRLNRPAVTGQIVFGSCDYSREELVAELTSAFVCAEVGIDNSLAENASYIHGWLKALEGDPKAVISASALAQRAANFIRGVQDADRSDVEAKDQKP